MLAAPGAPGATLAAALGRNPAAQDLPELALPLVGSVHALLADMTGLRGGQMHGLLRALSHLLAGEQTMAGIEMARRWLFARRHLDTADIAQDLARRIAPRVMVAPAGGVLFDPGAAARLIATFPQARLVHLQIHPCHHGQAVMAQAGGALAVLAGAQDDSVIPPLPDPPALWLMAEEAMDALAARMAPAQPVTLRSEDLLADPAPALAALARALGLPAGPAALAAMLHPERSVFAGPGPWGAHLAGDIRPWARLAATMGPATAPLTGRQPWRDDGQPLPVPVRARAAAQGYG